MSKIEAIARTVDVDALLDRLERLAAKDWRLVYDRFTQHSDAEWAKINTVLITAAEASDPYDGLSEQASERLTEELHRQISRVKTVAEQVPERAAGDPRYRIKLEFAIGRLVWLARKRDHIHSQQGERAVAIIDGLFDGLLPPAVDVAREQGEAEKASSVARRRTETAFRKRQQSVPESFDRLVAIWDTIEPKLLARGGQAHLTHGERLVHELFFRLDSEVRNGGVEQYLYNSAGDNAEHAKAYLAEIEAWPTLEVLDDVSSLFPGDVIPTDRRRRTVMLKRLERTRKNFSNPLGEATERFTRTQRELYKRIVAYVNHHPDDFVQSR